MGRDTGMDFWSRRRAAVIAEAESEAAAERAAREAEARAELETEQAGKSDAELLEELGLKDPDTLEPGDDFSAYLRAALPEHIKRRALRQLWRSNPVLANLDGLVDHGEDFTDTSMVVPGMQTAYQVGKGMARHVLALAEADEAGPALTEATADEDATPDGAAVSAAHAAAEDDQPAGTIETQDAASEQAQEVEAEPARPRRHMRFAFAS